MRAEIHEASNQDAKTIAELYNELAHHDLSLLPENLQELQEVWETGKNEEAILGIVNGPDSKIFKAVVNNKIVGFISCGLLKTPSNTYEGVIDIFLQEEYRGKGIGQQLVKQAEAWFKKAGCKVIGLDVYPQNTRAKNFYSKCGFTIVYQGMKKRI